MNAGLRAGTARSRLLLALAILVPMTSAFAQFDHSHTAWSTLLGRHVVLADGGRSSTVRYAALAKDREALKAYLNRLAGVTEAEFGGWTREQRVAFLVNAYNAFTIEKVLTRYPKLKSIRDFGGVIGNPWKDRFFRLFGRPTNLDGIEHEMLRGPRGYGEPRLHFALNCASIGCPMLREEAYVAERLDAQLEEQTRRFLSDRSRNRYNAPKGLLEVSRIFEWYREDWTRGDAGIGKGAPVTSAGRWFARYAKLLADREEDRARVEGGELRIEYLEYDWRLNDAPG